MKHEDKWYTRDTHKEKECKSGYIYSCWLQHLEPWTHKIRTKDEYHSLEQYIDELVDFATEIREHEPTWKKE